MAWTTLANRLSSLPHVLSGPILRKTLSTEVSVWIAVKDADSLTLKIYNEAGSQVATSLATSTVSLGKYLHVCVLTATPTSGPLTPGVNYSYDINFTTVSGTFNTTGILYKIASGISSITFSSSGFTRPTFSLPPSDFNKLRLVHASCRKPHGQGMDGMEGLHDMISGSINNANQNLVKAESRPHQLFLTGDQIYSDDVADALLCMIKEAATTLLDWDETLPIQGQLPGPGYRAPFMELIAKFTAGDDGRSHLVKLGEFYCMYLFVFSDTLWPTSLPEFEDVLDTSNPPPPIILDEKVFNEQRTYLENFRSTLFEVRKALANVPIYMMFDDHEITDDWYLNSQWYNDVSASQVGQRVIANGLSAYAMFQDWGNRPGFYASGAGLDLKTYLVASSNTPPNFAAIQPIVLPTISSPSPGNYPILGDPQYGSSPVKTGMSWNYRIEMPKYEVLVLDTRTRRGFPGATIDYPALIDPSNMAAQIPAPYSSNVELTIVVSPAPVFGMPRIEAVQNNPISYVFTGVETPMKIYALIKKADAEAWGLRTRDTLQDLLSYLTARATPQKGYKSRIVLLSGDVHYGFSIRAQYWATDPKGSPFAALQTPNEYNIVLAQLTASSLKNEDNAFKGSYNCHRYGYDFYSGNIPNAFIYFGYDTYSASKTIGQETGMPSIPAAPTVGSTPVVLIDSNFTQPVTSNGTTTQKSISLVPEWRYREDFLYDFRDPTSRAYTIPTLTNSISNVDPDLALATHAVVATQYVDRALAWGHGRESVGTNNIGEITFFWPSTGDTHKLTHRLWWRLDNSSPMKGTHTVHDVSLSYQDQNYQYPTP